VDIICENRRSKTVHRVVCPLNDLILCVEFGNSLVYKLVDCYH
jgi:hypothetical protein